MSRRFPVPGQHVAPNLATLWMRSPFGVEVAITREKSMSDSSTPAGWYPAPHADNELRYWDGARWLDWTPEQAAAEQRAATTQPTAGNGVHAGEIRTGAAAYSGATTAVLNGPDAVRARTKILAILALCVGVGAILLSWVPWLGLLIAVAAIVLGVVALVRKQPRGLALTGLILGAVALVVALLITVSFTAFIATTSGQSGSRAVPAVTTTPEEAEPQETEDVAEPEPEPEPELVTPDLATFGAVDERTFALIAKEPDAYAGTNMIVFGDVTQLDSATGPCSMLLSAAEAQKENSFDYAQNTFATSGDGESVCPVFDPLVEGDHVKMWVTVIGSFSYDTQIGGNTTVPAFQVWQAELLPPQEY